MHTIPMVTETKKTEFCDNYLGADILGEVLEQELVLLAESLLSHSHRDAHKIGVGVGRGEVERVPADSLQIQSCSIRNSQPARPRHSSMLQTFLISLTYTTFHDQCILIFSQMPFNFKKRSHGA